MKRLIGFGVVAACFLSGCDTGLSNKRADQEGNTVVGQSMARGKDYVCMQNLNSLRQGIELHRSSDPDAAAPTELTQIKVPSEMLMCPIGKEPYKYDPAAATVKCEHPGHKKY